MIKGQVQLQAWIDPDLREEVRERCHMEGVTIKEFVQQALRLRLAQAPSDKAEEATESYHTNPLGHKIPLDIPQGCPYNTPQRQLIGTKGE